MIILFYVPAFTWSELNRNYGIDMRVVTNIVAFMDLLNNENRKDATIALEKYANRLLTYGCNCQHDFIKVYTFLFIKGLSLMTDRYSNWKYFFLFIMV